MDFNTLSRRQLQALCKKNKIPANITNVAMADALNSLHFVEGIEEILNQSESEIAQSPMVPPTGGRSRTVKAVGVLETPAAAPTTAARRRAAAASTSVRRKIEVSSKDSLDEIEEVKKDVCMKTPAPAPASLRRVVRETSTVKHAYSTRRSARLAEKIEEPKEISEAIKINSFTEVTDENGDQSENSEITVLDNRKESEVTSNDESKETSEETSEIPSIEQEISSDIKNETYQEENEPVKGSVSEMNYNENEEVKASVEETEMYSNMDEETEASIEKVTVIDSNLKEASFEDGEMKFNVDEATKAMSIEDTEMNSNMDEETEASIEKVTVMDSNVNESSFEDGEMKSNVDEATKPVSIEEEDTDMNTKDDEEMDIAKIKVADVADSCNMVKQEAYADKIENDGYLVDNFTVNIQETNDKELPSENETSDDEESEMSDDDKDSFESDFDDDVPEDVLVPEVEIRDELLNAEARHEFNQEEMNVPEDADPIHIAAPLINDDLASTVGRLTQISDDKENVESVRKSVLVEEPKKKTLEEFSIRELRKMFKEKLDISKQQKKEDGMEQEEISKATTTRPALKALSENRMVVESQN